MHGSDEVLSALTGEARFCDRPSDGFDSTLVAAARSIRSEHTAMCSLLKDLGPQCPAASQVLY